MSQFLRTSRRLFRPLLINGPAFWDIARLWLVLGGGLFALGLVWTQAPVMRWFGLSYLLILLGLPMLLITFRRKETLWALRRHVSFHDHTWGLPAIVGKRVTLRYTPGLENSLDLSAYLQDAERHFQDLKGFFGSGPRFGVSVILLPGDAIKEIYGRSAMGFAMTPGTAVVAADFHSFVSESIRHEFTHLFARRCLGRWSCPLLDEGLAVWLQKTYFGQAVDRAALTASRKRGIHLSAMLARSFFFDQRWLQDCYILAGSFTGYLMRRLGAKGFWRFCHRTAICGYRRAIKRSLGMTLEQAEARWRAELEITQLLRSRMDE